MAFGGRRVVSFESRRAVEMASLIERHGGIAVSAPTVREVPLTDDAEARAFARALLAGRFDFVVLMTGVGTRALVKAMAAEMDPEALSRALSAERPVVVARGPKPASVLRELGVTGFRTVPEPNTWRQVLELLLGAGLGDDRRHVAIQEYGAPGRELEAALAERAAAVTTIPVYRWALPEDTEPLRAALHLIARGEIEVTLFTSRVQVEHALHVARREGLEDAVRARLAHVCVASIGPVCSEGLRAEGIAVDVEPTHPKMGHLVKETAERVERVLEAKRGYSS